MADEERRPSPLAGLAPPGVPKPAASPARPAPVAADAAAEARDAPAARWAEIAGAALGLAGVVPGLAVAAPVAHTKVVDRPAPEAFRTTILDALAREAAPVMRLELTVAIEGVPAAQAGEVAAAIEIVVLLTEVHEYLGN